MNDDDALKTELRQNNENAAHKSLLPHSAGKVEIQTPLHPSSNKDCNPNKISSAEKKLKQQEKLSQPFGVENHPLIRLLSSFICLCVLWALLYTLLEKEVMPGGKLLILIILIATAYTIGDIFKALGLPKLLGMLLSGILMRNFELFFDTKENDIYSDLVSTTRQVALTCILITAGLELDAKSMKRQSLIVLELSFIPCIIEAIGVALCCRFILNFSWEWGMLIGFIMGAVSPAIVVPALLKVQAKGYDPDKKISTIVIAAASFDDIVAISGFGIFFGMIFNEGDMIEKFIRGPAEVVLGIVVGTLFGLLSAWIPHPLDKHLVAKRVFIIGGGGLTLVFGSSLVGYDGAGPLACIVSAFVACIFWKWQGWSCTHNPVRDVFSSLWILLQPALFSLIGTEINLKVIQLSQIVDGLIIIIGGLVARAVACSAVLLTADVTWRQLVFINIAWIPKATVQAALGSLALDKAKMITPVVEADVYNGQIALMIAVLSILLTAPLGAIGINMLSSKLLKPAKENALTSNEIV